METLLLAGLAVGFGQIVKGVTGFGSALVAMPALVVLFGPRDAVAVMMGVDTLAGLALLPGVYRLVAWPLVGAVFVPLLAGQFVGTTVLVSVPERPIAMTLGLLVAVLGAGLVIKPVPPGWGELEAVPEEAGRLTAWGAAAGLVGGALQGTVGAAGPPIVAWARRYFSDAFGRAQLIAVFSLGAAALWLQLTLRNGGLGESGPRIAACILPLFAGSFLGQWLAPRLPREAFGRVVGVLLVGAGAALLLR
ncbi:MAG: sulfite exporter TauE/SafE family protein [Deltaproteobacteria bacterium]|nr:MAG: sulfite exporter TauE/SafE family protein [Deltaproteobacteria bacterium]